MSILLFSISEDQLTARQIDALRDSVPDGMTLVLSRNVDTIMELAPQIEIIGGWFDPSWLPELPNLRWVQQWGAGANWLMRHPDARQASFVLTNAVGVHAVQIGEHVFSLILAFARNLRNAIAAQDAGVWARIKQPSEALDTPFAFSSATVFELAEKTMLVLGTGAIGERVAKLAKAFDLYVIGVRRSPANKSVFVDEMVGPDDLLSVLGESDFIVNTLPMTSATKHYLDEAAFAAMKASAVLVNIGRGGTIDEQALIRALNDGVIAGAGLDVFEEEPLPEDSPLWAMPNVLITSHYAGASPRYHERALEIFLDNLQRYERGEPLRNVVDKLEGY